MDALAAGKHVYVEKPISNSVPRINAMLDAYNKYPNLVVQVGTHQRSWDHFIEAKKQLEKLDPVTHVLIQQPGSYAAQKQDPVAVPDYLDWDDWQVDAPKKAFKQGYLGFRGWWEYGSGLIGDWGAHHVDVANWFLERRHKAPVKTTALGFYSNPNIDPECVFNTFSIAWQFDTHVMTFANSVYRAAELRRSEGARHRGLGRLLLRRQRHAAGQPHGLGAAAAGGDDAQPRRPGAASRSAATCSSARPAPAAPRRGGGGRGRGGAGGPRRPGGGGAAAASRPSN